MVSIRWRLPDGAGVQRERELARHFVGVGAEAAQVRDRLLAQNLSWPKGLARGLVLCHPIEPFDSEPSLSAFAERCTRQSSGSLGHVVVMAGRARPAWECGTLSRMTDYDIGALIQRFDRFDSEQGRVTGQLSAAIGEDLLLDVLAHALALSGEVQLLPEVPRRDDVVFDAVHAPVPSVRDLDAWLAQAGELVAVECKHWTAASTDARRSVPEEAEDFAEYARAQWRDLSAPADWARWTTTTKIALPLRPPYGWTTGHVNRARRILIIWRPVSRDGFSAFSRHRTTTRREGEWVDVTVEVFSASIYLRQLLTAGTRRLPSTFGRLDTLLEALDTIIRRSPSR